MIMTGRSIVRTSFYRGISPRHDVENKTQILPHHCPFQLVRHCQNKNCQGWPGRGSVIGKLWISWIYFAPAIKTLTSCRWSGCLEYFRDRLEHPQLLLLLDLISFIISKLQSQNAACWQSLPVGGGDGQWEGRDLDHWSREWLPIRF